MSRVDASESAGANPALWYTRCPLPTASAVAIDQGILQRSFEQVGVQVQSLLSTDDPKVRQSHFDHGVRNLFRQGGNIPPIWSRSRGADTCVVGISVTREYQAIAASATGSIRAPGDLRGARLALPRRVGAAIDYWRAMCLHGYESALAVAGLTLSDVELVDLPVQESYIDAPVGGQGKNMPLWGGPSRARRQQAELIAFVRGEVDAFYASGALGLQMVAMLGAREVVELGFDPDPKVGANNQVPNILTVDRTLALERPDLVARYIAALNEAARWARAHPDEAARSFAREIGAPEEWLPAAYGDKVIDSLPLALDDDAIAALDAQAAFLRRHGFIDSAVSIEQWIVAEPLALANQEIFQA
ncbi:MAG: ABC transporter substrate-binding protein [Burkholderiales bacterium]|nr:ABC transporter substrate-binding protein [Burkholderiales bacterium]